MTNKFTVYTTTNCVNCNSTKEMMIFHEIIFEEILVEDDVLLEELREKGFTQFPVISVNSWQDSWCGFKPEKVEEYSEAFKGE